MRWPGTKDSLPKGFEGINGIRDPFILEYEEHVARFLEKIEE
jgi:hypothetical protein